MKKKLFIFTVVIFLPILFSFWSNDENKKKNEFIYFVKSSLNDSLFKNEKHVEWGKKFEICLITNDENLRIFTVNQIQKFMESYGRIVNTKIVHQPQLCQSQHNGIVILGEKNLGFPRFKEVFLRLTKTSPSADYADFGNQIAFSLPLPGWPRRKFIFLDTHFINSIHESNINSIYIEEFMHSITGLSDFKAKKIVSILGENYISNEYSNWYKYNPYGLCEYDFIIIEIIMKNNITGDMEEYIRKNYNELQQSASKRRLDFPQFSDPRC